MDKQPKHGWKCHNTGGPTSLACHNTGGGPTSLACHNRRGPTSLACHNTGGLTSLAIEEQAPLAWHATIAIEELSLAFDLS